MDEDYDFIGLRNSVSEHQAKIYASAGQAAQGMAGSKIETKDTSDLVYRFTRRFEESVAQSNKAHQYSELLGLLKKNPEVCRILELMQEVG